MPKGEDGKLRGRVVGAARRLFDKESTVFSTREVERDAGVGSGTLRRLFPTKELLIAEIVREDLEWLEKWADDLPSGGIGLETFSRWTTEMILVLLPSPGLPTLLAEAVRDRSSGLRPMSDRLMSITAELLRRSRPIDPDRSVDDPEAVYVSILAAVWGAQCLMPGRHEQDHEAMSQVGERLCRLTIAGLYGRDAIGR